MRESGSSSCVGLGYHATPGSFLRCHRRLLIKQTIVVLMALGADSVKKCWKDRLGHRFLLCYPLLDSHMCGLLQLNGHLSAGVNPANLRPLAMKLLVLSYGLGAIHRFLDIGTIAQVDFGQHQTAQHERRSQLNVGGQGRARPGPIRLKAAFKHGDVRLNSRSTRGIIP